MMQLHCIVVDHHGEFSDQCSKERSQLSSLYEQCQPKVVFERIEFYHKGAECKLLMVH
ncbi:hypothetical protein M758_4G111700 [Ceratodon purpureus]|uniref:Uncharacterized protein n=1 Tax=Ceratodon purpureus TaxID=3225 RepID=A0A8T0IB01_CERPU|nr:hypothetical protein KC19_4G112300 [Ceratodon purpureus]KAG0619049.1 hypothetical protein M758_4G111700 [Ceratodon purpureus]